MANKNSHGYVNEQIIYVEPNYSVNENVDDYFKKNDEDYCIYVDLQVEIFSRETAFSNTGKDNKSVLCLSWVNNQGRFSFMQGRKYNFMGASGNDSVNMLSTEYTDIHYTDIITGQTAEMFGIESIDIMYNNRQIPEVTIKFKDVRGAALFAPEELRHNRSKDGIDGISDDDIASSFFKSFFMFPWPKYTLLVKGFYGQPVSYELTCHDFKTNFDSSNGNFNVTAKFVGYDASFLNDVSFNALIAAPNSNYLGSDYWNRKQSEFQHLDENGNLVSGLPKITELISDFKNFTAQVESVQGSEGSPGKAVTDIDNMLSDLSEITSKYESLMNGLKENIPPSTESGEYRFYNTIFDNDNSTAILVIDKKSNNNKQLLDAYSKVSSTTSVGAINDLIKEFNNKYKAYYLNEIKNIEDIKPIQLFENSGSKLIVNNSETWKTFKGYYVGRDIKTNIFDNVNGLVNKINSYSNNKNYNNLVYLNYYGNCNVYIYEVVELKLRISEYVIKATSAREDALQEVSASLKKIKIGGGENAIVPNIENITRVLAAHLDTYMYMLKTSASEIYNQNRTKKSMGLVGARIETDVPDRLTQKYVGPWPDIKKQGAVVNSQNDAARLEDVWIGDAVKTGNNTIEAQFINGLLNGTKHVQETFRQAQRDLEEMRQEQEQNQAISESTPSTNQNNSFSLVNPIIPYDFILNGNPFGNTSLNTENINDVYSRMFVRMCNIFNFSSITKNKSWFTNENIKKIARLDAQNFLKKFGDNNVYNQEKDFETFWNLLFAPADFWKNQILKETDNRKNYKLASECFENRFPLQNLTLNEFFTRCENNSINDDILDVSANESNKNIAKIFVGKDLLRFKSLLKSENEDYNTFVKTFYDDYLKSTEKGGLSECFKDGIYKIVDREIPEDDYEKICTSDGEKKTHIIPKHKNDEISWNRYKYKLFGWWPAAINNYFEDGIKYQPKGSDNLENYNRSSKRGDIKDDILNAISLDESTISTLTIPTFKTFLGEKSFVPESYFISELFYKLKTIECKALGFLGIFSSKLNSTYNNTISYFSTLSIGGWLYVEQEKSTNTKILSDLDYVSNYRYFTTTVPSKIRNNKSVSKQFIDLFKSFVSNEFKEILEAYEIRPEGKDHYTASEMDDIRTAFKYGDSKHTIDYYLKQFKSNFFENYFYFDDEGCLLNRQETKIMKKIVSWLFTPVLIIYPSVFAKENKKINEYYSVGNTYKGYYKTYFNTFTNALKEAHTSTTNQINSEISETQQQPNERVVDEEISRHIKIALYKYTKNLYDRWCSVARENNSNLIERDDSSNKPVYKWDFNSIMERFHFLDCYYNYIGDQCMINMESFFDMVGKSKNEQSENDYYSLATFLNEIFYKSNVNMVNVQNFIDLGNRKNEKGNKVWIDSMKQMFEPISFLDMKKPLYSTHFVCMYKSEASKHLDIKDGEYENDGFMIDTDDKTKYPVAIRNKTSQNGYLIPAFGVSYGTQYQSYFKDIDISNDSPMMTEVALKAQFNIISHQNGDKQTFSLGQDLYTIYANNSYTCTIKMMGCAWVQPLMYFCLLNIPLFRGTYLIEKVTHSIRPGFMETTITGVRMARNAVPFVDTPYLSTNNNYGGGSYYSGDYVNMKYKRGSIENDCGYTAYPLESLNASEGGFSTEYLNQPMSKMTQVQKRFADDVKLIDALTWISWHEIRVLDETNKKKLDVGLVDTVIFNRLKRNSTGAGIFAPNQFQPADVDYIITNSKIHSDIDDTSFNKVKSFLTDVLQNTPSILDGLGPIKANEDHVIQGTHTNRFDGQNITIPMLQRVYGFRSDPGHMSELSVSDLTSTIGGELEVYFQHGGHVFQKRKDDKPFWEYSKKVVQNEDESGLSELTINFINALQKTMDSTDVTSGVRLSYNKFTNDDNYIDLTCSNGDVLGVVFDMILQTYYEYVEKLYWISLNNQSIGRKNPAKIRVKVCNKDNGTKKLIGLGYSLNNVQIKPFDSINPNNYPHNLIKSVRKRYNDKNIIKEECQFLSRLTDDQLDKLFVDNNVEPCYVSSYVGFTPWNGENADYAKNWKSSGSLYPPSTCGAIRVDDRQRDVYMKLYGCPKKYVTKEMVDANCVGFYIPTRYEGAKPHGEYPHALYVKMHKALKDDVIEIFTDIMNKGYIVYNTDGGLRTWGTKANNPGNGGKSKDSSHHCYGLAIDINPFKNPNNPSEGSINPAPDNGDLNNMYYKGPDDNEHIRTPGHFVVQKFLSKGWGWLGYARDFMHFSIVGGC